MNFKRFEKRLPDTYQELEYIQNGSLELQTGYIDTGLVGTDLYGCEIETCMKVTAISSNLYYLNGAYKARNVTQIGLIREDTEYVHSVVNMGFNAGLYSGSIALNDWHTIYTSDGIQKTDGIIVGNETYGTFNNLHYLLFARSDASFALSPPFAMKYFWIKKNGQYIRNMIPAKRKSDDVVGMYDIANDVFYTSENQYTFIGGDVAPVWHDIPHYIHNTSTDTITTLPADIYANGTTATVGVKGQMEQTGTPTPSSPIQPSECGEMSGNILTVYKENYSINASGEETYNSVAMIYKAEVAVTGSTFTFNFGGLPTGDAVRIHAYTGDTWQSQIMSINIAQVPLTFTVASDVDNIRISIRKTATDVTMTDGQYKIPILNNSQTTNVYLGEVESTRRIKKLVLTGQEDWAHSYSAPNRFYRLIYSISNTVDCYCSHFIRADITNDTTDIGYMIVQDSAIRFRPDLMIYSDTAAWKQYLADQYSAGTPVTVWYVLAEPTTGIVNEPLRKIGNYADTVSDITIPTIAGANTVDVLTTLKPSEVTATYKGWHSVANVHERENGAWD